MNKIVDVKEAIWTSNRHSWWENWVWNDGSGKKVKKYDINEVLSPIEAFEKCGLDPNKKWEIKA